MATWALVINCLSYASAQKLYPSHVSNDFSALTLVRLGKRGAITRRQPAVGTMGRSTEVAAAEDETEMSRLPSPVLPAWRALGGWGGL